MITRFVLWLVTDVLSFQWLPPFLRWVACVLFHPHHTMEWVKPEKTLNITISGHWRYRCTRCKRTWTEPVQVEIY